MSKNKPVQYLFRKPIYPVIVDVDNFLVCGKSAITLSRRLSKIKNFKEDTYKAIDYTGEGWDFYSEQWILSPLAIKKRWSKLEIIKLYNGRKNKNPEDKPYSEKSLSSKRLDKIINDIFELLNRGHRNA